MASTYQDRIGEVIKSCGGASKLARIVSALTGEKVSQQAISNLANRKAAKPARSSKMNAAIATAGGMRAQWLEYGEEPMEDPFAHLDRQTYLLILTAAAKLHAPALDSDIRNNAISALRMVAKQDIPIYRSDPAVTATPQIAHVQSAKKSTAA